MRICGCCIHYLILGLHFHSKPQLEIGPKSYFAYERHFESMHLPNRWSRCVMTVLYIQYMLLFTVHCVSADSCTCKSGRLLCDS